MDLLVKLVTARNCVMLLAVAGLARAGAQFQEHPRRWYLNWRYPALGGAAEAGKVILDESERRESGRVEARYRRLLALLAQARADGFDVGPLEHKARAALALNVSAHRRRSVRLLSEIEMAIPRKKRASALAAGFSPAPAEEIEPDVSPAPVKPTARTRRR